MEADNKLVSESSWEPNYSMGYGVIHFAGGGSRFFQGDEFTSLDDELNNAPTNETYLLILQRYED